MDLTQNLSIQNMIRGMLDEAKVKIAMDEAKHNQIEKKERKVVSSLSEGVNKLKGIEKEEAEKCASLDYDNIEKLASAVDYISTNFDTLLPKGILGRTLDKTAFEVASGPGALNVTQTRGGSMHLRHPGPVTPNSAKSTEHTGLDSHMGGAHNQIDNTHDEKPGDGSYDNHHKMPLQNPPGRKEKMAQLAKNLILSKLAGEDVAKASIKASKAGPHAVGKGPGSMTVWDIKQGPSAPSSGGGHLRSLIASNEAARNFTKKDAIRGRVRSESAQVWDEPAFRDPTLQDTFVHNETAKTSLEGGATKTATQIMAKVASQGCVCDGGYCPYCTMVSSLRKLAGLEAMQPAAGAPPTDGAAIPGAAPGAGADPAMMGQAPGRPEGCQCSGQPPLCKVCKLQMMLQNMQQQQGALPGMAPGGAPPPGGAAPPGAGPQMPPQMGA